MEIDDAIVQLGAKLDAWWEDDISPLLDSEDRVAQAKALLSGFELAKEFDRLKADGLAAITALLARQDETTEEQRVASLKRCGMRSDERSDKPRMSLCLVRATLAGLRR
jgi:hypothetical protein